MQIDTKQLQMDRKPLATKMSLSESILTQQKTAEVKQVRFQSYFSILESFY